MVSAASIFSSTKFIENPYKKSLLEEAMNAPEKEIKELVPLAKEKQMRISYKIVLLFQKIWHLIKLCLVRSYRESFDLAAKKIEFFESESIRKALDVKADMLNSIGANAAPRMQEAWTALFSDCDKYLQSWNCASNGNYTLELTQALNIRIPADSATLQFAKVISGNLNKSSQEMSFDSGFTTEVPGVAGSPSIFWMSYTPKGDIISIRGGYHNYWPFAETKDNPAATIINNWKNHQIA